MNVTAIVPCYNEENRILPVINAIKKSKLISEIIIVDDGSNNSSKQVLKKIKGIKILTHPRNLGKSKALKTGLLSAQNKYVFFIDSDLVGLKPKHVDRMIDQFIKHKLTMILSERELEHSFNRFNGFAIAYTGERILPRDFLIQNISVFDYPGYLIEPAINRLVFSKYKAGKIVLNNVGQVFKIQKGGLKHWINDYKMVIDYIKFLGPKDFLSQLVFAKKLSDYS
jgi:glycosyltransferase involved in cell wall biosynthesis